MTTTVTLPPEQQAAHEAIHGIRRCPNCDEVLERDNPHRQDVCLLSYIGEILSARGLDDRQIAQLQADCDADTLWTEMGDLVSRFAAGEFKHA